MFHRQLSTNALNTPTSAASPAPNQAGTATRHGPRLFQRQMTASQLFSSNFSHTPNPQDNSNVKRLLANSRADPSLASSAACLTTATNQAIAAAAAASGARIKPADGSSEQAPVKKAPKNKRIISRMLSISAIHTTVGSGGGGSSNEVGGSLAQSNNSAGLSGGCLSDDTNQSNDAVPIGASGEQQ